MSLPKETLSELLNFLADHESFESVRELGSISAAQVRTILKELAQELKREATREMEETPLDPSHFDELSPEVKQALSELSPVELQRLVRHFGIEN